MINGIMSNDGEIIIYTSEYVLNTNYNSHDADLNIIQNTKIIAMIT